MDISRWTIDERMMLPDFCFGSRKVVSAYSDNLVPGSNTFAASVIKIPDPVCIWSIMFEAIPTDGGYGYLRFGLNNHLPVDDADMSTSAEILPAYGINVPGPNLILCLAQVFASWNFNVRKGMVTHDNYLVIQNSCLLVNLKVQVSLVISELPKNISGYLANQFLTEVR